MPTMVWKALLVSTMTVGNDSSGWVSGVSFSAGRGLSRSSVPLAVMNSATSRIAWAA